MKVSEREIAEIAQFLGMTEHDFIQRYTRLRQYRDGLALIDKPNGECAFLEDGDCSLQPVKPQQCRDFPNRWNFPGWREVCEAIPVRATWEAVEKTRILVFLVLMPILNSL